MLSEAFVKKINYSEGLKGVNGSIEYNAYNPIEGSALFYLNDKPFYVNKLPETKTYKLEVYKAPTKKVETRRSKYGSISKSDGYGTTLSGFSDYKVSIGTTSYSFGTIDMAKGSIGGAIPPPSPDSNPYSDSVKPVEVKRSMRGCNTYEQIISSMCFAKVTSFMGSAAFFGYKPTKSKMFESKQLFNIVDIHEGFMCKKDGQNRDIVELLDDESGKKMKFLLSDVEIVYPDLKSLTKGYNIPKSRTIKKGITATIKDDRKTGFKKNDKVKVIETTKVGGKKYAVIQVNDTIKRIPSCKLKVI